jgi:hypothetical protein
MSAMSLLENFAAAFCTIGTYKIYQSFRTKYIKSSEPDTKANTIPYAWYESSCGMQFGFACIKCGSCDVNRSLFPICECEEYIKEHFHFMCRGCKFKAVMRTADDR